MSRLAEIKSNIEYNRFGSKIALTESEYNYLIQQAERVQELEEDLLELVKQNKELRKSIAFYSSESYNAHLERLLDRSEKQNKRYREALEFYADRGYYYARITLVDDKSRYGKVYLDEGQMAREALEGEE